MISDAAANTMLDSITTFYLALFTTNPNFQTGVGGTEATGGSYARQEITMGAASGRARTNTGARNFASGTNLANDTYTGYGIYSAASAGDFRGGAALAASRVIAVTGDNINFAIGDIDFTLPAA